MLEALQFIFPPFVAAVSILVILGYLGLHVLEREIIFIDIALAQFAATGSTVALILFHLDHHEGGMTARLFAVGFTFIAAAFFSFVSKKVARISQETVIGVSYAIAAAATLFLLATAAGSDVHMEEMLTGSLLWASWSDIIQCLIVYGAVGVFHIVFRRQFMQVSRDYKGAERSGVNVMLWDFLFYASMGIVITFTVEFAGVLLTFSFLIIPATFSAMIVRNWGSRIIVSWILGIVVSIVGLSASFMYDTPCGPTLVSVMGFVLVVAAIIRRFIPSSEQVTTDDR